MEFLVVALGGAVGAMKRSHNICHQRQKRISVSDVGDKYYGSASDRICCGYCKR